MSLHKKSVENGNKDKFGKMRNYAMESSLVTPEEDNKIQYENNNPRYVNKNVSEDY